MGRSERDMWGHNAFPEKPSEERWLHLPLHSEPSHTHMTPPGARRLLLLHSILRSSLWLQS